jgi:hypothetical protein
MLHDLLSLECVCFFSVLFSRARQSVCVRGKLADEPAENVIEGKRFIAASCGLKRARTSTANAASLLK